MKLNLQWNCKGEGIVNFTVLVWSTTKIINIFCFLYHVSQHFPEYITIFQITMPSMLRTSKNLENFRMGQWVKIKIIKSLALLSYLQDSNVWSKSHLFFNISPHSTYLSIFKLGIPWVEIGTFLERSYYPGHVPIMHP